jgi:hypothetical protein
MAHVNCMIALPIRLQGEDYLPVVNIRQMLQVAAVELIVIYNRGIDLEYIGRYAP